MGFVPALYFKPMVSSLARSLALPASLQASKPASERASEPTGRGRRLKSCRSIDLPFFRLLFQMDLGAWSWRLRTGLRGSSRAESWSWAPQVAGLGFGAELVGE